jgi:putative ABC transport system substrate-binding protein
MAVYGTKRTSLVALRMTIPIVFEAGSDPVRLGLVTNLNHPGGDVTGVTSLIVELAPKRLELLHELLPTANAVSYFLNPADRALAQAQARELISAANKYGLELHIINVNSERDFDAAFADVKRLRTGGLVIGAGSVFVRGVNKLAELTVRHAIPAIYLYRDFPAAGGLMSYGSDILESYRGISTGRVLKGENPAELPVVQPTKFELVINKTAKALGVTVACSRRRSNRIDAPDVRFWPKADMRYRAAHVRFRAQSRYDQSRMSAFAVAIRGKADTPFCTAYVR